MTRPPGGAGPKPMTGLDGSGVRYDDAKLGETFASTMTVTETHLVLGAGLVGDFNPHHVNETYARGSRYGGRILHGVVTSAIVGAPMGMYFHGTAIGFLEHHVRFLAPVYPGDTLTTTFRIVEGCLDGWTPAMLDEEIRRDFGEWKPVHTRGWILQRVFAHDVYHCAELNEAFVTAGLPQIDLWE